MFHWQNARYAFSKRLLPYVTVVITMSSAIAQDFIKAPNGTYWKIDAGLKREFTSSESIAGYGLKIESAVPVTQQQFESYPVGEPMPTRKMVHQSMKIGAQSWGELQIPVQGWTVIDGPHVENGSDVEVQNVVNGSGDTVAIKIRSYNPNLSVMGMGKSRTVKVTVTLEK